MSRILVTTDDRTVAAEVTVDDEGTVSAVCEAGDWATVPSRGDTLADVVDYAATHVDRAHR